MQNSVAALEAHFDDSCTDDLNTRLVIAGFATSVEQWSRFTGEWNSLLNDFEVPYFKAKEFDDGRRGFGLYKHWSEEKRREFLGDLLGIIARRVFKGFATLLDKFGHDEVVANGGHAARRFFPSQYSTAAFLCIQRTSAWRDELYQDTPVRFVFDAGHRNEEELRQAGRQLKRSDRLIVDVNIHDDRKLPPLQAADLLAFELCSDARRQTCGDRRPSRYPLQILGTHPHEWITCGKNELLDLLNAASAE